MNRMAANQEPRKAPGGVRLVIALCVILLVALIHVFRIGSYLNEDLSRLYYAYFSDIVIPIAVYFLLCINDAQFVFLRSRGVKAALVFGAASCAEVGQAMGLGILGRTFDPLDFAMYAIGTLLAVALDAGVFTRLVPGWSRR